MKKRIEKVVECVKNSVFFTEGKREKVFSETKDYYSVMNKNGDIVAEYKDNFKVVSEREVLEFEGEQIANFDDIFDVRVFSEIDLHDYDLKVIATPKDSHYEGKSKEELIEIIKELKSKE